MLGKSSIQMPYLKDGMLHAVLEDWKVGNGDLVEQGQVLFEANLGEEMMGVESFDRGEVVILAEAGKQCVPGELVGYIVFDERDHKWNEHVRITLDFEQRNSIDRLRGDLPRSRFLQEEVQSFIDTKFNSEQDVDLNT